MSFTEELKSELSNILQYWITNTIDHENGGFVGEIALDNSVVKNAGKGAVLNARILWTFSSAYRLFPKKEYLEMAERAYDYLVNYFWDKENGGLYWEVNYQGIPVNTRKQIYAQGFGLYGFSEFYRATGNTESLEYAQKLFELIEKHSYDPLYGGYIEALSQKWEPMADLRLSAKDENTPKSMNTHLHIIEPYTNLFRVWKDEKLNEKLKGLLNIFLTKIIDSENARFNLFFDTDWTVLPSIVSYGHDIEGTWLITEAAEVYGNKDFIAQAESIAIRMTENVLKYGSDNDGSIYYEKDLRTNHLDTDKHWWPQAEALVGYLNSYQITKDRRYIDQMKKVWKFIKNNLIDKQHGEWYWLVRKDGSIRTDDVKVGFWKCPYHNARALMEVIERIEKHKITI